MSAESRERAAALLPGVPLKDIPDVIDGADLVLLAVPDDALPELVAGLAATDTWQAGQIVVHTSAAATAPTSCAPRCAPTSSRWRSTPR